MSDPGLARLWAGWRAEYVGRPPVPCVMCAIAGAEDREALVVERTAKTLTVLNLYPYCSGHLMVVPLRHEAELDGLDETEARAVMAALQRATRVVKAVYAPDGLNVGINLGRGAGAGVPGHLHVHVVPRWAGDTNFMTAVADARVLPESLAESYERLRAAWPEPGAGHDLP